jgi:uncharacterized protein (DUF488 family)
VSNNLIKEIFTIGHSTRRFEDLLEILRRYRISLLVDIRHFPRSCHNPQFNKETLEANLPAAGIAYHWLEKLGGFRPGGYEAYTASREFAEGLEELKALASEQRTAIMCAGMVWFRCHRRFVADKLAELGFHATHILDEHRTYDHTPKQSHGVRPRERSKLST